MRAPLSPPMSDDERAAAILSGEYWVCDRHGVLTADQVSPATTLLNLDATWVYCLDGQRWPGCPLHYAKKGGEL